MHRLLRTPSLGFPSIFRDMIRGMTWWSRVIGWGSAKVRLILEKALFVSRLFVEGLAVLVGSIPAFTCRRAQDMLVLWSVCIQSDSRVDAPACLLEAFETGADRKVPSARTVEKFRTGRAKRFEGTLRGAITTPFRSIELCCSIFVYISAWYTPPLSVGSPLPEAAFVIVEQEIFRNSSVPSLSHASARSSPQTRIRVDGNWLFRFVGLSHYRRLYLVDLQTVHRYYRRVNPGTTNGAHHYPNV